VTVQEPTDVAENTVAGSDAVAIPTLNGLAGSIAATLLQGSSVAKASVTLAAELVRIALGRSEICPEKGDWRFKDPTWSDNPVYKRVAQCYLAWCHAVDSVLDEVDRSGNRHRAERARFVMNALTSAAAPTNTLLGNPAALKKTFETSGANLVRGAEHWVSDLRHNGGMPSMAKPGALKVGEDLAITPGKVVDKDDSAELLQYTPATEEVYERPVLVVPPPIGRYYFLDLRPGRGFVEYSVSRGLQTFLLSWRNPQAEQSDWTIDTYAQRILEAIDAVREVTGAQDVNVIGFCAGGILNTAVLNKLAAAGDDRTHSASYAVTLLDFGQFAPIGAFSSARLEGRERRCDQRTCDGQRVHVDAAQRPGVELLGQQLPDGRGPTGLRHLGLERRRYEPAGEAAPAVPGHLRAQPAARARCDGVPWRTRPPTRMAQGPLPSVRQSRMVVTGTSRYSARASMVISGSRLLMVLLVSMTSRCAGCSERVRGTP